VTPNPGFTAPVEIRFNDIDAMGHVNNAVIFSYFEEGRKALFYDTLKDRVPGGFNFIMAHLECDYLLPIRLDDRLLVNIQTTTIGTKSFGFAYRLSDAADAARIFATGSSVQVCYDWARRRSVPVPDNLRAVLGEYLAPV
jgi:acyl-CoA thioester hydrolase